MPSLSKFASLLCGLALLCGGAPALADCPPEDTDPDADQGKVTFKTLNEVARNICERGQKQPAKFRKSSSTQWVCDRCPADTEFGNDRLGDAELRLGARGHFSSRAADEQLIVVAGCESHLHGYVRTFLVRKIKGRYQRIASRAAPTIDYAKALRVTTLDGQTLLVGEVSFSNQVADYTQIVVVSVYDDEIKDEHLLGTHVRARSAEPLGTPCASHLVESYALADVDHDGDKDLVVRTSKRVGSFAKDKHGDVSCKLKARRQRQRFQFLFDGEGFVADGATMKLLKNEQEDP